MLKNVSHEHDIEALGRDGVLFNRANHDIEIEFLSRMRGCILGDLQSPDRPTQLPDLRKEESRSTSDLHQGVATADV
jgi:hypothetical protein